MATSESCEECGFEWGAVSPSEITERLNAATDSLVRVMETAGAPGLVRPSPERWSVLEYAAHLRDVLLSIRERIITAAIIDEPTGTPIYRDDRVALGLYEGDYPGVVANELSMSSQLFVRTFQSLTPRFERREFFYSPTHPDKVTILWAGAQALHECEHHLNDVTENMALLPPSSD
ncbi:MAG: DinB family protein [Acidimicrobiales bacterium]